MLGAKKDESAAPKCYLSEGSLLEGINWSKPPEKGRLFSKVLNQKFNHTVELILPEEVYEIIQTSLEQQMKPLQYARVNLSPSDLLESDFFNTYIKIGNILMLSEGRPGVDTVFSLCDGILRIELDKATYERAGLTGKSIRDGGRKHVKARYAVELNLRLPSMLHGKKGFERITWAFKNVLNETLTWFFCDLTSSDNPANDPPTPITSHLPFWKSTTPSIHRQGPVVVPPIHVPLGPSMESFQEDSMDILEWLGLASLGSPRILLNDVVDPYLSRYQVSDSELSSQQRLVKVVWTGLLPSRWVLSILAGCWKEVQSSVPHSWFAFTAHGFVRHGIEGDASYTILRLPTLEDNANKSFNDGVTSDERSDVNGDQYILWDVAGALG